VRGWPAISGAALAKFNIEHIRVVLFLDEENFCAAAHRDKPKRDRCRTAPPSTCLDRRLLAASRAISLCQGDRKKHEKPTGK
jgi:hypothetical protein